MKITRRQLRKLIRETINESDPSRPWGSYAEMKDDGSYFSDTITMSPNGDSVLVDGMETYITDVPQQLDGLGFPMNDTDGDNLIFALEDQMDSGYVELSVEYKDGKWSW